MAISLQLTKDNSHTLYVPELDETYHSRNGAVEEALYVYIGRGLLDWFTVRSSRFAVYGSLFTVDGSDCESEISNSKSKISNPISEIQHLKSQISNSIAVLEVGFGTGLNAWLTALEAEQLEINCHYHSLETYPLSLDLIAQLNYTEHHNPATQHLFLDLHQANWHEEVRISPTFQLTKFQTSLQEFMPTLSYDIIYFDAFAPEKQPELWTKELFQKLYDALNPEGIIVTYSSKGDIKRMWREIGFDVERLPGPPMKRHMLRGRKI